jgi:hypothetical protein
MRDSTLCWSHDPSFKEQRRRTAARGGRTGGRGRKHKYGEVDFVKEKVLKLTRKVERGKLDRGDAAVIFQGFNVLLNAIRTQLKQREQLELVDRFEQLEEALTHNDPSRYHHYGR